MSSGLYSDQELKSLFNQKVLEYKQSSFIESDPIQIPHRFTRKEDIEIIGFLVASISWGQRATIIKNGLVLCELMGNNPLEFITNKSGLPHLSKKFVHRTFNSIDLEFFLQSLRSLYMKADGLEGAFSNGSNMMERLTFFREQFFKASHQKRSEKHVSNPMSGSACKRINMFLRWMVRNDDVDFGLWKEIAPSELLLPLDVHTGNVSREFGLLSRKQNDWRAVEEVSNRLKLWNPDDPIRYDFALFGIGVNQKLKSL